ncbi:MAG: acyl-CoA dehydrogenase family protein [SAR324 cluster bacterium]|nr:acyl-CoA dehydrogenase family protein [SAR324 cluster bacterium]
MIFTEEHERLRETVRGFIEKEINPHVEEWEEAEIFPAHEVFKKMGALGLLGITKPVKYGGLGLDYSFSVAFAEELGRITCGGVPTAIGVQTDMCTPALARFGSDALCREFLAPSIAGDYVGCLGVSEVGAGSDVASLATTARKDGGDYVINGGKMWTTNGAQADWMCLLANTSNGPVHKNKSLIVVPMKEKGVVVAKKLKKLGGWSSDTVQIFFEDVRVPQSNRIGEEGKGFTYQMMQFQEERLFAAAKGPLTLQLLIEETIEYTRQRQAFGQSILDNQVVHFTLAELRTKVELLRALTYQATERYVAGEDVTLEASMAKLTAGRLAREVTDKCLQFWGGMGYMWESRISRAYRDARLGSIGGGADEIMLSIIGKYMGILPKRPAGEFNAMPGEKEPAKEAAKEILAAPVPAPGAGD